MGVKVFLATVQKELQVRLRAYPISFMVSCLTTGVYTNLGAWLMYHCFFEGKLSDTFAKNTGTGDYMSYVIIGSCTYMFVVRTCLNVSRTLVTELREGTLESLMLAPFHRSSYFLGNMALQTMTTFLELLIAVFIGFFFGLRINHFSGWQFVVAVLLSLYSFFGISMLLGCLMLYTRNTYVTQNTLFSLIFLLCGITFPKEYLPIGLRQLGSLLPVTDALDLLRSSLLGGMMVEDWLMTAARLFVLSSIYIMQGFPLMEKAEKIALEKMEG